MTCLNHQPLLDDDCLQGGGSLHWEKKTHEENYPINLDNSIRLMMIVNPKKVYLSNICTNLTIKLSRFQYIRLGNMYLDTDNHSISLASGCSHLFRNIEYSGRHNGN